MRDSLHMPRGEMTALMWAWRQNRTRRRVERIFATSITLFKLIERLNPRKGRYSGRRRAPVTQWTAGFVKKLKFHGVICLGADNTTFANVRTGGPDLVTVVQTRSSLGKRQPEMSPLFPTLSGMCWRGWALHTKACIKGELHLSVFPALGEFYCICVKLHCVSRGSGLMNGLLTPLSVWGTNKHLNLWWLCRVALHCA